MGQFGNLDSKDERFCHYLRWAQVVVAALALVAGSTFLWKSLSKKNPRVTPRLAAISTDATPVVSLSGNSAQGGRLYPYSVIPGGARDAEELKNALLNDPVAALHYAGFDVSKTHVVRLNRGEAAYVSYRIGDHIYWTSKKLWLPEGETVLTDGEHEARTRCGNRISETPKQPVALTEPSRAVLETPIAPELAAIPEAVPLPFSVDGPAVPPGADGETAPVGGEIFLPPVVPIWGGSGTPGSPTPSSGTTPGGPGSPTVPTAPTPEPASLLLLSAGIAGLWVSRRRARP